MHPLTTTVKNWVFKSYFFVKIFLIYDYPQLREMRGVRNNDLCVTLPKNQRRVFQKLTSLFYHPIWKHS